MKKERIKEALEVLDIPSFISYEEIKKRYHILSKEFHPDFDKNGKNMQKINEAYSVLKDYIFNYRFSFSDDEISRQFPEDEHTDRFRF